MVAARGEGEGGSEAGEMAKWKWSPPASTGAKGGGRDAGRRAGRACVCVWTQVVSVRCLCQIQLPRGRLPPLAGRGRRVLRVVHVRCGAPLGQWPGVANLPLSRAARSHRGEQRQLASQPATRPLKILRDNIDAWPQTTGAPPSPALARPETSIPRDAASAALGAPTQTTLVGFCLCAPLQPRPMLGQG